MAELAKIPGAAPSLFWFETRNLFLVAERRGRLQPGEAATTMAQLRGFPILDEGTGSDRLVLALAERHGLSGYDASYLALAISQNCRWRRSTRSSQRGARCKASRFAALEARHERRRDRIACPPPVGRRSANPAGP